LPACLEAFALYKAQIKEADDSEAFITLLENSQVERLFDASTQQDFFRGVSEQQKPMTELELVRQAAQLLDIPLEQLVHSGALLLAKREILTRTKHLSPAAAAAAGGGGAEAPEFPRAGSGVTGSADNRIKEAFEFLRKAGKEVTPARLAKLSRTNFNSAQRWIGLNHPQLLLNKTLRPRQARPMREKPPTAAAAATTRQPESSTPPSPPPPQKKQEEEETLKSAGAGDAHGTPKAKRKEKTKSAPALQDSKPPQSDSPPTEPIAFTELELSSSQTIKLAYGVLNQRGAAFFSVEPFGKAALDEALRAHQLDRTSFGHVELIEHKGHHLVPLAWLILLLPNHQPFLEKLDSRIYRSFKGGKKK
jgi:hypothetical protein